MRGFSRDLLRWHPALSAATLIGAASVAVFASQGSDSKNDEITVRKIHVVDAAGRERLTIGGDFGPRRAESAGILFHNEQGTESGGLVYHGRRGADGQIEAGGILTFDQFGNDQIMTLEYTQTGDKKRNGIEFADRPDELSARVLALYRAVQNAQTEEDRERVKREMLPAIPRRELSARRLFVGRSLDGVSLVSLCDAEGRPRLNLEVDQEGAARITFVDASGKTVRTIAP